MNKISKLLTSFKNWWNSLGVQTPPHPVASNISTSGTSPNTMLARNRDSIAISIFILFLYVVLWKTIAPYLGSFGTVVFLLVIAEERLRREAIKDSRLARELHDQQANRFVGRIRRAVLGAIVVSIVIKQNLWGIGDAITNSLPFISKAAELVLLYTNGVIEDMFKLLNYIR